jgi:hypothetical protein
VVKEVLDRMPENLLPDQFDSSLDASSLSASPPELLAPRTTDRFEANRVWPQGDYPISDMPGEQ